jgi:hypothetical protein
VAETKNDGESKRDGTSIKLFFVVLGAIVAYQLSGWMRGEAEWRTYTSETGQFVVEVAGSVDQRTLQERLVQNEIEFEYLMFARGNVQYAIAYGEVANAEPTDGLLQAAVASMAEKVQGEISAQHSDTLASVPALRAQIRAADDSELHIRCLWHAGRLYRLMAGGETDEEGNRVDIEHFFSSFRPTSVDQSKL